MNGNYIELRAENLRLAQRARDAEQLNAQAAILFRLLADAYPTVSAPRRWLDQYQQQDVA